MLSSFWLGVVRVGSVTFQLFATPWTLAYQAPLSMEFSRQEYWSGVPFSSLSYISPLVGKIPRRRALQLTPVFLPEKPHEQRNLVDSTVCGVTESRPHDWATEHPHTLLARTNLTNSLCSLNQAYLLFILYTFLSLFGIILHFSRVRKSVCCRKYT